VVTRIDRGDRSAGDPVLSLLRAARRLQLARGVDHRIITDLAVLDITADGLVLRELAPGVGVDEFRSKTGAPLDVTPSLVGVATGDAR
jgi:3-oxoacid CoA-transferase subunit B